MLEHPSQLNITQSELAPRVADYFDNLLAQRDEILARYQLTPETAGKFCDIHTSDEDREKILALYEKMVYVIAHKQIPPGETCVNNVFTVPDSLNPYADAFKQAGLPADHSLCLEKKEMTLDIPEIIAFQTQHYRARGRESWADDIEQHIDQLYEHLSSSEEQHRIEMRIKAGYIPVVMPGRDAQLADWEKALCGLRPVFYKNRVKKTVHESFLYLKGFREKMIDPISDPRNSFFRDIPERPYLVWTKPFAGCDTEIDPAWKTTVLAFEEQEKKLAMLHSNTPELCDKTDITPLEYAALQSLYTETIRHSMNQCKKKIYKITPLDVPLYVNGYTWFIAGGLFPHNYVPFACFDSGRNQLHFSWGSVKEDTKFWFRPVARS